MSLKSKLKSLVPPAARRKLKQGLGIRPPLDEDWRILAPIGPVEGPHVVFDVGAHRGYFLQSWRKWCPGAEIHAFEPAQDAFDQLSARHGRDPGVHLNHVGVGDAPGSLTLNITSATRSCNSFLPPKAATWQEVQYTAGEVLQCVVPVTTLDHYVEQHDVRAIHLIKIDVQGFELKVLQGAARAALPRTSHLLVESAIRPLYEGAPRFSDVFNYVTAQGFHLIGMRSWHRGNHTLMEADLLFRRDDLMPPVAPPPGVDKIVEHVA
jgi:FkbM family methyltransferase